jgi:hypothetical protein
MLKQNWKKYLGIAVVAVIIVLVLIQLIPVDKTNPAVVSEPNWDAAPGTRALVVDACFDCHSNETEWPWYAKIAPSSWLLSHDVEEGRSVMNFSDWQNSGMDMGEIQEVVDEGEMPPWYYSLMHPNAKLSDSEKQQMLDGLRVILSAPTSSN